MEKYSKEEDWSLIGRNRIKCLGKSLATYVTIIYFSSDRYFYEDDS